MSELIKSMESFQEQDMSFNECSRGNKYLSRLINLLKKDPKIPRYVKDPKMLIESLEDFNQVIGNDSVKESLAKQIDDIIASKVRTTLNPKVKPRNTMINIMLYGPPGTGKTMISNKIGKVMYSVGQLRDYKIDDTKSESDVPNINMVMVGLSVLFLAITIISALVRIIPERFRLYAVIFFIILGILAILLWYCKSSPVQEEEVIVKKETPIVTHATRSHFLVKTFLS